MLDLFRTLPPILLYHARRDLIYPYGTVVAQANVLFSSDLVKSSVIEISLILVCMTLDILDASLDDKRELRVFPASAT